MCLFSLLQWWVRSDPIRRLSLPLGSRNTAPLLGIVPGSKINTESSQTMVKKHLEWAHWVAKGMSRGCRFRQCTLPKLLTWPSAHRQVSAPVKPRRNVCTFQLIVKLGSGAAENDCKAQKHQRAVEWPANWTSLGALNSTHSGQFKRNCQWNQPNALNYSPKNFPDLDANVLVFFGKISLRNTTLFFPLDYLCALSVLPYSPAL